MYLLYIIFISNSIKALTPKSSTINDATTVPITPAIKKSFELYELTLSSNQNNAPANESPAPVGSFTLLVKNPGKA